MGIGVDKGESGVLATSQVVYPASKKGEKGNETGNTEPYVNITTSGEYISSAIRKSVEMVGEDLYMSHNLLVIFGKEVAQEGLRDYFNYLILNTELRTNMFVLISKEKASDIYNASTAFQEIPAIQITKLVESQKKDGAEVCITILDFVSRLASKRQAAIAPMIEIEKAGDKETPRLSGTAVFSGDKMVGELTKEETRGYIWIAEDPSGSIMKIEADGAKANIEITASKGRIGAEIKDDKVKIKIYVSAAGTVTEVQNAENLDKIIADVEKAFADGIKNEIRACIKKSRNLKADVLGFESAVYRKSPKTWQKLNEKEVDMLSELEVEIIVETQVVSTGIRGIWEEEYGE